MNFDDHEIWSRPVPEVDAEQPEVASPPPAATGRLYASAGAPAHPDAIVALPNHSRSFVSVAELPEAPVPSTPEPEVAAEPIVEAPLEPTPVEPAPVTTKSAPIINDPAIAEVLGVIPTPPVDATDDVFAWARDPETENTEQPEDPFKDWYAEPSNAPATPVKTGLAAQQMSDAALRARTQLQDIGEYVNASAFTPRAYFLISFIASTVVGVINVLIGDGVGIPFGVALLLSTAFSAWKLPATDRWVGWVFPAYVAIASVFVAGQFGSSAPGFNPIGQVLLVATTMITVAPWLAAATAIGAVLPRLRKH